MAGMWIVHANVKDDDRYAEYIVGATEAVRGHGGEYIARGGRYRQPEGSEYPRNVVVRFPTYEKAVEAYESDQYQSVVGIAKEASNRMVTIVEVDD